MNCECAYVFPKNKQTINNYFKLAKRIADKPGEFDPVCLSVITQPVIAYQDINDIYTEECRFNERDLLLPGDVVLFACGKLHHMVEMYGATPLFFGDMPPFEDFYTFSDNEDYSVIPKDITVPEVKPEPSHDVADRISSVAVRIDGKALAPIAEKFNAYIPDIEVMYYIVRRGDDVDIVLEDNEGRAMRICKVSGVADLKEDVTAVNWVIKNVCTGVLPVCTLLNDIPLDNKDVPTFVKKNYSKKANNIRHKTKCEVGESNIPVIYETPSSWIFHYDDVSMVLINMEKTTHIYCPDPILTRDFNRPDVFGFFFCRNEEIAKMNDDEALVLFETIYKEVCNGYSSEKYYYDTSDPDCPYVSADEDGDFDALLFDKNAYKAPRISIKGFDKKAHTFNGILYISNGDGTCTAAENLKEKRSSVLIPEVSPEGDTVTAIASKSFNDFCYVRLPETIREIGKDALFSMNVNKPRDLSKDSKYYQYL